MTDVPPKRSISNFAKRFTAWQMLARRDFRLLWLGQSVSILGDQFYLVALPWLVLHLTGSSLALGSILMTATAMRVAFQLVGGAISDMVSQRKMMIASSLVRAVVCGTLTALVLVDRIRIWHLFIIVAVFGMADAFFLPALKAFIPGVIPKERLVVGNSLLNTSSLLAMFLGPSLAGIFISVVGTGAAFAFDTASFLFVALCLLLMRRQSSSEASPEQIAARADSRRKHLLSSIGEGLRYTYYEPTLRALLTITAVVEFAFAGPFTVGLASLANVKFAGQAVAFGALLSSLGGGLLVGTLVVGATHARFSFGKTILWLTTGLGFGLTLLGVVPNVFWACALMAIMGIIAGYTQVLMASWLQSKSDPHLRGRVISVVMLSAYGLTPLSYMLTGALTQISVSFMFIVTGLLLLVALAICAFGSSGRALILSN
ncbi:MAG TPA: MFS transporter [Pyrinomonadaceae bacterium]|nr:MFS transporter [Pyrinomonadaceae bacterium]